MWACVGTVFVWAYGVGVGGTVFVWAYGRSVCVGDRVCVGVLGEWVWVCKTHYSVHTVMCKNLVDIFNLT